MEKMPKVPALSLSKKSFLVKIITRPIVVVVPFSRALTPNPPFPTIIDFIILPVWVFAQLHFDPSLKFSLLS